MEGGGLDWGVHFTTTRSLTWSEVSLHVGKDGVAGRQIPDTDAHEVFAHLRLPEQVVELRGGTT